MGRRGPQPIPQAERIARGNPGNKVLNRKEPKYAPAPIEPPDVLDEIARKHWDEYAPPLIAAGVMKTTDVPLFAAYCAAYSDFVRASIGIAKTGDITDDDRLSPFVKMRHMAMEKLLKYAGHFGLTPSTRMLIRAEQKETTGPNVLDFLTGKQKTK